MDTLMQECDLGTEKYEPDGSVYKYGKIDFGICGITDDGDIPHIQYAWIPWNIIANSKGRKYEG